VQVFSGSPGYTAPAAASVSVTPGNETDVTATYTGNPPVITSGSKATAIEGQPFSYQATISPGATDFPATYAISTGALPPGLALNGTSGLISGTIPMGTGTGVEALSLQATNSQGTGNPLALALTIAAPGHLAVSATGEGTFSKTFLSPTIQAVNSSITIKASPSHGYLFAYWSDADTGAVLSTQASYTFSMPTLLNLRANFIVNPFLTAAGSYLALVQGASYQDSGYVQFNVKTTGKFAATLDLGGASVKADNSFTNDAQFNGPFTLPGNRTFNAALSLTAGGMLTGTLTSQTDSTQMAISAERAAPHSDQALAGTYTVELPAASGTAPLPGGNGYGTLTIAKTGAVKFAGKLGDGLPVTLSGYLDSNGVWPFLYVKPAGKKEGSELLLGPITFPPPASGTAGQLSWYRAANTLDTAYPAGFSTSIPAITGTYKSPAVSYPAASIIFSGGDLNAGVAKALTISPKDKVTYAGSDKFSLTFASHTGLFSGSFSDTGTLRHFAGAVLQSGSSGVGLFQEKSGKTGSVILQGAP
jgi:hypothetical protein